MILMLEGEKTISSFERTLLILLKLVGSNKR